MLKLNIDKVTVIIDPKFPPSGSPPLYGRTKFSSTKFSTAVFTAGGVLLLGSAYRGFKRKGDRVLYYSVIVVPHLRYGLKRYSGMLGSILDLNEGMVQ